MALIATLIFLFVGLLSISRLANGAIEDVHCPRSVDPPPEPTDLDRFNGWKVADYVLRSVLRDDPINVDEPELGKTYAFFAFPQGDVAWENFCNGGWQ